MILPSVTPEMVQKAMSYIWSTANLCWQVGLSNDAKRLMKEYDYLSNYMTADQVSKILESCE